MQRPSLFDIRNELIFLASRSGGPGGQNVNKVNSKVTLKFDIGNSGVLTLQQKELMITKLASRVTREGVLLITVQEHRSQRQNKEGALVKLEELINKAFTPRKSRKATKPGAGAARARLNEKKHRSEKKQWRNKKIE